VEVEEEEAKASVASRWAAGAAEDRQERQ